MCIGLLGLFYCYVPYKGGFMRKILFLLVALIMSANLAMASSIESEIREVAQRDIKCQLLCPVRDNYLVRFFGP